MEVSGIGLEIVQAFSPVFIASLTWAAGKLAQLIRAKVHNEAVQGLLLRLDDAVLTTAKGLQQTLVTQLKTASSDGKLSHAEKQQLKEVALATVKMHLGEAGRAEITRVFGAAGNALDNVLSSKIEAAVYDLRSSAAPGSLVAGPPPAAGAPPTGGAPPPPTSGASLFSTSGAAHPPQTPE